MLENNDQNQNNAVIGGTAYTNPPKPKLFLPKASKNYGPVYPAIDENGNPKLDGNNQPIYYYNPFRKFVEDHPVATGIINDAAVLGAGAAAANKIYGDTYRLGKNVAGEAETTATIKAAKEVAGKRAAQRTINATSHPLRTAIGRGVKAIFRRFEKGGILYRK